MEGRWRQTLWMEANLVYVVSFRPANTILSVSVSKREERKETEIFIWVCVISLEGTSFELEFCLFYLLALWSDASYWLLTFSASVLWPANCRYMCDNNSTYLILLLWGFEKISCTKWFSWYLEKSNAQQILAIIVPRSTNSTTTPEAFDWNVGIICV